MNRKIELTENEVELLSKILIEFRCREGIGLEHSLGILHYKINGFVGFPERLKAFNDMRYNSYRDMFKNTSESKVNEVRRLVLRVNNTFSRSVREKTKTNIKGADDE